MTANNGNSDNRGNAGSKKAGYKSPPLHGQIRPGEVRNPHGRNGKKKDSADAFEKVRRRDSRVTVSGEMLTVENEEAFWLSHWAKGMSGNMASARIVAKELSARRALGPPPPTAEELAQNAADLAERERLSAYIVNAIERMASQKRRGDGRNVRVRFGLDGRPILETPTDSATAELDEPNG